MTTWTRNRLTQPGNEAPFGINLCVGMLALVTGDFVAARVPASDMGLRCAVVAVALMLIGATTVDWQAVLALLIPGWLLLNGFLINRLGELSWHGWPDVYRLSALAGAGLVGLIAGEIRRGMGEVRERDRLGVLVHEMSMTARSPEIDEENRRA